MSYLHENALTSATCALRTAARDVACGASLMGRGTIGAIGVLTLLVGLALFGSAQVRDRVVTAALAMAGIVPAGSRNGEPARAEESSSSSARSSHWLSASPQGAAEPAQEQVTRYLARRYKVAEGAVRRIVGEAFVTGRALGLDPLLILAVTAVESSLNPFAQSPVGAQGLMQVMTRVHSDKFADHGGDDAALDPIANLRVGSAILRDLIRRGGSVERGLQLYVGAGNLPDDGGYAARVLAEQARIRIAAGGHVREALAAAEDASRSGDLSPTAASQPVAAAGHPGTRAATDRRAI